MKRFCAVLTVLAVAAPAAALAGQSRQARQTTGVVYASVTHAEGRDLYVSGDFRDRVLGRGAIVYVTNVGDPNQQGSVEVLARRITIYTRSGSLAGTGRATQTVAGNQVTVTDGTFRLTSGTGAYRGRRMTGTFSGEQNQEGVYRFEYRGTLR